MVSVKNVKRDKNYCHDCKKEVRIERKEVKNGVYLVYKDDSEEFNVFKCSQCFKKNPSLTNFRECEVYSRVVGYLRPVQQWNFGKRREFKERKEFKI
jgi:anaerobic ribonucleoside-triphosphate reductase